MPSDEIVIDNVRAMEPGEGVVADWVLQLVMVVLLFYTSLGSRSFETPKIYQATKTLQ